MQAGFDSLWFLLIKFFILNVHKIKFMGKEKSEKEGDVKGITRIQLRREGGRKEKSSIAFMGLVL